MGVHRRVTVVLDGREPQVKYTGLPKRPSTGPREAIYWLTVGPLICLWALSPLAKTPEPL